MRIKRTPDGNKYLLTEQNMWVRNLASDAPYVDLNNTIQQQDHFNFLQNEIKNNISRLSWINSENINMRHVLIVSDGYDFEKKHRIVESLPKDITIIGVNSSLKKWNVQNRNMNWYLANNPYEQAMNFMPRRMRVLPRCIVSPRTNYKFVAGYNGAKYKYYPVNEKSHDTIGKNEVTWQIDDYRNPICAAIGLAYRFGAEKICLLCCDNSFDTNRDGSEKLKNGLYQYPQQQIAHGLIDGIFYWLKNSEYFDFQLADCSSGKEYNFAEYITEEDILPFFNKVGEK